LTDNINGAVYNCFFSFTTPAEAAGYTTSLSWSMVAWNLLFNLGFMYTDIRYLIDELTSSNTDWENVGKYIGDFMLRFIYSRYVPRAYYMNFKNLKFWGN
jgi:hypothetical protein